MSVVIDGLEILEIPSQHYHAADAVGHSSLVKLMRSPAHYRAYMDSEHEPSPAMEFGTAFHMSILEPELFKETYAVTEKFDLRTKIGKENALAWKERNLEKTALTEDQMLCLIGGQKSVNSHVKAARYLSRGVSEQSVFWVDSETGIACKCRPDFMMLDENGDLVGILDVKSTRNASKEKFSKSIIEFGYDLQAAFYSDPFTAALGREIPFFLLAVESEAPHGAALYRVGDKTMELGRKKYQAGLQLLQWCRDNKSWPSYQPFGEEEDIDVPHWAFKLDTGEDV